MNDLAYGRPQDSNDILGMFDVCSLYVENLFFISIFFWIVIINIFEEVIEVCVLVED